jgi:chromosome partitioning protein
VNLAAAFSSSRRTVIIDADPQQSSLQWRDIAADNAMAEVIEADQDTGNWHQQIKSLDALCIFDCPPSVHSEQMQMALQLADLALVPVQPSPVDIWATVHVESEVEQALQVNPQLQAMLVINQLEPRTRLSKLMDRAVAELSLPVAATPIRRRAIYRNSFLEGRTVHDIGRQGAAAAVEIGQLMNEIRGYL